MRKSLLLFVVILAASVAVSGRADKAEKQSIAVSTIKVQGKVDESMGPLMTGLIVHNLLGSENLKVVQSQLTDEVLRVLESNMSDLCDQTKCETEPGKFVQIQKLVAGDLSMLGGTYILNLRIVDVQSNTTEWSLTEKCSSEAQMETMAKRTAFQIRNNFGEKLKLPAYAAVSIGGPRGPADVRIKEINPSEEQKASSGPAAIYISTRPRGAKVYLDGAHAGSADPAFQKRNLTPGRTMRVTLKKENYHDTAFDVPLTPGIKKYEGVELEPAFGTLSINSNPEGAVVKVAGREVGKTPYRDDRMPSGKHLVSVQKELYERKEEMLVVRDEQTTEKTYRLKENYGTLSVDSEPAGASVIVQGEEQGKTPAQLKLEPGTYKITLKKSGHFSREFEVTMAKGKQARISSSQAKLELKAGTINVFVDPPLGEVQVLLDGEYKGTAPVTLTNVPEGNHVLEIEKKGYHANPWSIYLSARETKEVSFDIEKGPATRKKRAPKTLKEVPKYGPMVKVTDYNFYIDKYEVTNKDYNMCVRAGKCRPNKKYEGFTDDKQPVVGVTHSEAHTYCRWAGKRLPSAKRWYKAAVGPNEPLYPWGKSLNCDYANYVWCRNKKPMPVGSYPQGATPYGAMDMAGNVWEWTSEGQLRGGSYKSFGRQLQPSYWRFMDNNERSEDVGFRCIYFKKR